MLVEHPLRGGQRQSEGMCGGFESLEKCRKVLMLLRHGRKRKTTDLALAPAAAWWVAPAHQCDGGSHQPTSLQGHGMDPHQASSASVHIKRRSTRTAWETSCRPCGRVRATSGPAGASNPGNTPPAPDTRHRRAASRRPRKAGPQRAARRLLCRQEWRGPGDARPQYLLNNGFKGNPIEV